MIYIDDIFLVWKDNPDEPCKLLTSLKICLMTNVNLRGKQKILAIMSTS